MCLGPPSRFLEEEEKEEEEKEEEEEEGKDKKTKEERCKNVRSNLAFSWCSLSLEDLEVFSFFFLILLLHTFIFHFIFLLLILHPYLSLLPPPDIPSTSFFSLFPSHFSSALKKVKEKKAISLGKYIFSFTKIMNTIVSISLPVVSLIPFLTSSSRWVDQYRKGSFTRDTARGSPPGSTIYLPQR